MVSGGRRRRGRVSSLPRSPRRRSSVRRRSDASSSVDRSREGTPRSRSQTRPPDSPPRPPTTGESSSHTRTARLQEREELQQLNARLEQYILRQRTRDARRNGTNLDEDSVIQIERRRLQNLRETFLSEYEQAKKHAHEHEQKCAEALETVHEQQEQIEELTSKLKSESELKHAAELALNVLKTRVSECEQDVETLQNQLEEEQAESVHAKQRAHTAELAAHDSQQTIADLHARMVDLNAERASLADDFSLLKQTSDEDLRQVSDELKRVSTDAAHLEDEIRTEFTHQMHEVVRKLRQEYQNTRDKEIEKMKEFYERATNTRETDTELLNRERRMSEQLVGLETAFAPLRLELKTAHQTIAALEKRNANLVEALEELGGVEPTQTNSNKNKKGKRERASKPQDTKEIKSLRKSVEEQKQILSEMQSRQEELERETEDLNVALAEANAERERELLRQKREFQEEIVTLTRALEDANNENSEMKNRQSNLQRRLSVTEQVYENSNQKLKDLTEQQDILKQSLNSSATEGAGEKELHEANEKIIALQASYNKLQADYNEVVPGAIALKAQLEEYERMLVEEEVRVGIRKRRRSNANPSVIETS